MSASAPVSPVQSPHQGNSSTNSPNSAKSTKRKGSRKLRPISFPATVYSIGSWRVESEVSGDLLVRFYYSKRQIILEFMDGGISFRMEIGFDDVSMIGRARINDQYVGLALELSRPPHFLLEVDPQPRMSSIWTDYEDFTNGEASAQKRIVVTCPKVNIARYLEKLKQSDDGIATKLKNSEMAGGVSVDSSVLTPGGRHSPHSTMPSQSMQAEGSNNDGVSSGSHGNGNRPAFGLQLPQQQQQQSSQLMFQQQPQQQGYSTYQQGDMLRISSSPRVQHSMPTQQHTFQVMPQSNNGAPSPRNPHIQIRTVAPAKSGSPRLQVRSISNSPHLQTRRINHSSRTTEARSSFNDGVSPHTSPSIQVRRIGQGSPVQKNFSNFPQQGLGSRQTSDSAGPSSYSSRAAPHIDHSPHDHQSPTTQLPYDTAHMSISSQQHLQQGQQGQQGPEQQQQQYSFFQ